MMLGAPRRVAFRSVSDTPAAGTRVYSICYFPRGFPVPDVKLIDADSDEDAVEYARSSRPFTMREIWDHHRLVAVIRAV